MNFIGNKFVIPHKHLIESMIFAGLPILNSGKDIPTINEVLSSFMYNSLNDDVYLKIEQECRDIEKQEEEYIIDQNRVKYEIIFRYKRSDPILPELSIPEKIADRYRYPDALKELVHIYNVHNKTTYDKTIKLAVKTLELPEKRRFLENAIIHDMTAVEVSEAWEQVYFSKQRTKVQNTEFLRFEYFLFNIGVGRRFKDHITKVMIENYFELEPQNIFYRDHRRLLYRHADEFRHLYGITTGIDREITIKRIFGMLRLEVMERIEQGIMIPPDIIDLFKYVDAQYKDYVLDNGDNKEIYKKKMENIISRLSTNKKQRILLEDLRDVKFNNKEEIIVQDAPYLKK